MSYWPTFSPAMRLSAPLNESPLASDPLVTR
jgi:hypothetical protein